MHNGLPVIDAHVHLAPQRLARAVHSALAEQYGWRLAWPTDPDEVLADIRASGADLCVHLPYAHRPGIATALNEHGAGLAARHRDVLAFATVHPDDPGPVDVLEAAVAGGCRGLKVHCVVQRTAPDDPRMRDVYTWCERERLPILMHAGHAPDPITPTTGVAAFAALMRRYPDLTVCVAHLGGPESSAFLELLPRHDRLWLDVAGISGTIAAAGAAVERVLQHADRVVYGSDYPNIPVDVRSAIGLLEEAGFAGDALAGVLAGNAGRFLGVDAAGLVAETGSPRDGEGPTE